MEVSVIMGKSMISFFDVKWCTYLISYFLFNVMPGKKQVMNVKYARDFYSNFDVMFYGVANGSSFCINASMGRYEHAIGGNEEKIMRE